MRIVICHNIINTVYRDIESKAVTSETAYEPAGSGPVIIGVDIKVYIVSTLPLRTM